MASVLETIATLLRDQGVDVQEAVSEILLGEQLSIQLLLPGQTRSACLEKLRNYETRGIPEVWIVSTDARSIEVLHLKSGYFTTTALLRKGTLRPQALPNIAIDIATLFE